MALARYVVESTGDAQSAATGDDYSVLNKCKCRHRDCLGGYRGEKPEEIQVTKDRGAALDGGSFGVESDTHTAPIARR